MSMGARLRRWREGEQIDVAHAARRARVARQTWLNLENDDLPALRKTKCCALLRVAWVAGVDSDEMLAAYGRSRLDRELEGLLVHRLDR